MHKVLILFIVLWAALAIVLGVLNKADADLGSGPGDSGSVIETALKLCAVIFTAVAAVASGVVYKLWKRLTVYRAGFSRRPPTSFRRRYRPPPHGFSLLRTLQIIIV
jgi:predicted secreted protein